jgi:hypothetical protein
LEISVPLSGKVLGKYLKRQLSIRILFNISLWLICNMVGCDSYSGISDNLADKNQRLAAGFSY